MHVCTYSCLGNAPSGEEPPPYPIRLNPCPAAQHLLGGRAAGHPLFLQPSLICETAPPPPLTSTLVPEPLGQPFFYFT